MIPALIGVALIILLIASRVADEQQDERRAAAAEGEPASWSWRSRVGVMAVAILLMPLSVAIYIGPAILTMDGPAWWWAWLAGAVAFVVLFVVAEARKF